MGTEHIGRLALLSLCVGLIGASIPLSMQAPTWAAGIVAGMLWGVANLLVLRFLIVRWIRPRDERRRDPRPIELILGLLVKVPVLYGTGYLLLRSDWFRVEALVIGFIVPFGVAFVDAVVRMIRGSREERAVPPTPPGATRAGTKAESGC
jgi:hypothetical protein